MYEIESDTRAIAFVGLVVPTEDSGMSANCSYFCKFYLDDIYKN